MADELILHGISHAFGERRVLDDVDLTVPPGRIVGLLGPNGAGKSTLMRVLFGVIEPDAGTVEWRGRSATGADRRGWGYMPQERGLYLDMRVHDQLVWLARLHGVDRDTAGDRRRTCWTAWTSVTAAATSSRTSRVGWPNGCSSRRPSSTNPRSSCSTNRSRASTPERWTS
jgi:ABC-type uncharacterized transport system ATPase subunit